MDFNVSILNELMHAEGLKGGRTIVLLIELPSENKEFIIIIIIIIMPLTSKKLTGHIGFGLCVRPSVRPFIKNRAC